MKFLTLHSFYCQQASHQACLFAFWGKHKFVGYVVIGLKANQKLRDAHVPSDQLPCSLTYITEFFFLLLLHQRQPDKVIQPRDQSLQV